MRSYYEIYIHINWAAKNRESLVKQENEDSIYDIIKAKCQKFKTELLAFGNTDNHVHLLIAINPNIRIVDLVSEMKGASSFFINKQPEQFLKWQDGFGCLSVGKSELKRIKQYIERQKEHHSISQGLLPEFEIDEK